MKSLRLTFWDHSWRYDGSTPENYPLGGSQSALVYLTRVLAKLGHDVHIYNNCESPGIFHGVHFHQIKELHKATRFIYTDAFISLRDPRIFPYWLNAGVRILWAQDAYDQEAINGLKTDEAVRQNIDYIFCISRWQAWTFINHFHWPARKIYITRNAVWPEYYQDDFTDPPGNRLVYTSTPFRGLELLLKLFPGIHTQVPDSELHVFSSMQVYQENEEKDQHDYGHIYELAAQPGVIMHGSVGQKALAEELTKCKILAYPNIYPETGCISAMEALAAGSAVVSSELAALPETIGPGGILIPGIPGTDEYNHAFVKNCVRLLTDQTLWRKLAMAGREWILNNYTWDKVALEWSEQINILSNKVQKKVNKLAGWQPSGIWRKNGKTKVTDSITYNKEKTIKPLRLVFADDSWPFDDSTPENSPLGGCHSALVYLTRELTALGHEVLVYNNCNAPGIYHGVHYHQFNEINHDNRYVHADAFISLRNPSFFSSWINGQVRILWVGDAFDQPHLQPLKTQDEVRKNIDSIFCVSRWQAWSFLHFFHWSPEKIYVTRNGVYPQYFPREFQEPQGNRLVYTSTPFRGLKLLLELFPEIYKTVPDAELHVFSSMQVYHQSNTEDLIEHSHIYKLSDQPGVVMHGSVGQKELSSELVKSRVFAYPNIFPETSCIAAMEAMAAGCAVVTSSLAALPETVGPAGLLIPGMPGSKAYNDAFVENCVRLLTDHAFWRKTAMAGKNLILKSFTWKKIALEWSEHIDKLIRNSEKEVKNIDGWQPQNCWRDKNERFLMNTPDSKLTG